MKKILLSLVMVCSIAFVNAQALLNELYTEPNLNAGHSEFFELYNIAPVGTGAQNLNCYTLVTFYEEGSGNNTKKGFYVLDFPNLSVAARSWFVGAAAYPFNTQNPSFQNVIPDFSWNSPAFRNGSTGGSLTKWQLNTNGTGYTQVLTPADSVSDFLSKGSGSSGDIFAVVLYRDGIPENFFFGGMSNGNLPANISSLPDLFVDMDAACTDFTITFSNLGLAGEFKGNTPGTDNGYARTSDGKCGAWDKTASGVNHTPGATNGSASNLSGSLAVAISATCGQALGDPYQRATVNVTGFSGSITFAEDFPIKLTMYYDNNHNGILDGGDTPHNTIARDVTDTAVATVDTFHLKEDVPGQIAPNWDLIFAFRTKRGCFDRIQAISLGCSPLPVNLTTFTAARTNSSTVKLQWETAQEENNKGFAIQRLIGNGSWQIIGFVNTKAVNGNSNSPTSYEFTDLNNTKGISQYRLKQIDIDGKLTYSQIRAVRGESQKGKTIVYPNPSSNGQINIIFEDKNSVRDIVVTDMSGRTIKQWKAVTNNNIQIDNLNAGMYTVRIVNNETGEQEVQKFIVNKR